MSTARTITLDPVTRIEGHLRIELDYLDNKVSAARSSGTSFRGFEPILVGRDPRDAVHITQRICGVCPVPQARASVSAFEAAAKLQVNDQARLIRNILEASNFIDSHLVHCYLMVLPDYVIGMPTAGGWPSGAQPRTWNQRPGLDAAAMAEHALVSLRIRRDCSSICTLLGGKIPHQVGIVPGGATALVTADMKATLSTLADNIAKFVSTSYRTDVEALAVAFEEYFDIGVSDSDFISAGGFPEADGRMVLVSGVVRSGSSTRLPFEPSKVGESVASSRYTQGAPLHPGDGATKPQMDRAGAYSWTKAARLDGRVCEVGPLARAVVAGRPFSARGVMARHMARVAEANLLAVRIQDWIAALQPGVSALPSFPKTPASGKGAGLVEAPRGFLGHWLSIEGGVTKNYQVISPTTWNGSPRDDQDQPGPLERALAGLEVEDPKDPIEVMRVIHSFDPCLQCAVH